jgi:uncharacterized membrane protein
MSDKISDLKTYIISVSIVIVSAIIGVTVYNINDRTLMSRNIDNAIAKSMDPLAVRCSYVTNTDTICVAHAAANGNRK